MLSSEFLIRASGSAVRMNDHGEIELAMHELWPDDGVRWIDINNLAAIDKAFMSLCAGQKKDAVWILEKASELTDDYRAHAALHLVRGLMATDEVKVLKEGNSELEAELTEASQRLRDTQAVMDELGLKVEELQVGLNNAAAELSEERINVLAAGNKLSMVAGSIGDLISDAGGLPVETIVERLGNIASRIRNGNSDVARETTPSAADTGNTDVNMEVGDGQDDSEGKDPAQQASMGDVIATTLASTGP